MGKSIGNGIGIRRARTPDDTRPVVAVIGDSTFIRSGITGLIDAVYNNTPVTVCILDNRTTAMTGGQEHPLLARRCRDRAPQLDLPGLVRAVSVEDVLESIHATWMPWRRRCALYDSVWKAGGDHLPRGRACWRGAHARKCSAVSLEECTGCQLCFRIRCPADRVGQDENRKLKASVTRRCATAAVSASGVPVWGDPAPQTRQEAASAGARGSA